MKKLLSTAVILTTIMMLTVSCNETKANVGMTGAVMVTDGTTAEKLRGSDETGTNSQSGSPASSKDNSSARKKKIDTATVKLNKLPLPPELSDLTTPDLPGYPHAELLTMDGDNLILDIGAISLSGIFGRSKGIYSYNVKDQKLVTLKDLSEEENRVWAAQTAEDCLYYLTVGSKDGKIGLWSKPEKDKAVLIKEIPSIANLNLMPLLIKLSGKVYVIYGEKDGEKYRINFAQVEAGQMKQVCSYDCWMVDDNREVPQNIPVVGALRPDGGQNDWVFLSNVGSGSKKYLIKFDGEKLTEAELPCAADIAYNFGDLTVMKGGLTNRNDGSNFVDVTVYDWAEKMVVAEQKHVPEFYRAQAISSSVGVVLGAANTNYALNLFEITGNAIKIGKTLGNLDVSARFYAGSNAIYAWVPSYGEKTSKNELYSITWSEIDK